MEKSSGLKECPRCGLRNRRGAYQCDFCGWDFKAGSDDWLGQLNDLEKLGQEAATIDMDTTIRSKIELTMKRPADMPSKERMPEAQAPEPAPVSEQDHGDVMVQPVVDVPAMAEPVAETVPAAEAMEDNATAAAAAAAPEVEVTTDSTTTDSTVTAPAPSRFDVHSPYLVPAGTLGGGLAAYAASMLMVTSDMVGTVVGWGIAIPAAALMAYGVMRLAPLVKGEEEKDVVLCPACHEVVTDHDVRCPSCGETFVEPQTKR